MVGDAALFVIQELKCKRIVEPHESTAICGQGYEALDKNGWESFMKINSIVGA